MDVALPPLATILFMAATVICFGAIALAIVRKRFSIRLLLTATTAGCVAAALLNQVFER